MLNLKTLKQSRVLAQGYTTKPFELEHQMSSPHKLLISSNYSTVKTQNHLVVSPQSTNQCHPNSHTQLLTLHGAVSAESRDHKTATHQTKHRVFHCDCSPRRTGNRHQQVNYMYCAFILLPSYFLHIVEPFRSALERPHLGNTCSCG